MVELPDTDKAYFAWIDQHPDGYVINAHRSHSFPMYWHQATCGTIKWENKEVAWVEGEFIKACSTNPGELAVWAKARREDLHYCKHCLHAWEKAHHSASSGR